MKHEKRVTTQVITLLLFFDTCRADISEAARRSCSVCVLRTCQSQAYCVKKLPASLPSHMLGNRWGASLGAPVGISRDLQPRFASGRSCIGLSMTLTSLALVNRQDKSRRTQRVLIPTGTKKASLTARCGAPVGIRTLDLLLVLESWNYFQYLQICYHGL